MIEVESYYVKIFNGRSFDNFTVMERDQFYPTLPEGRYDCKLSYDRIVFCDGSEMQYLRKIVLSKGEIFINVR